MKDSQQRIPTERQDSHTFWGYVSTVLGVLSGASYFVSHALSFVLTILTIVSILIAIHLFMKEKGWMGTYAIPLALGIIALYVVVKVFDSFQNKKQSSSVTKAQPRDTGAVNRDLIQSTKTKLEEPKATKKQTKKTEISNAPTLNVPPGGIGTIGQQGNNTINNTTINSSDRIIPPNVVTLLKTQLSQYPNKHVTIRIANNDFQGNETANFATQLRDLFVSVGWNAVLLNSGNTIGNGKVTTGTTINAIGQSNVPIADLIRKQFMSLGYHVSGKAHATTDDPIDLLIEVWTK